MVLFEIWSVGKKPFSQLTNNQVFKLIQTSHCQPPPPGCPRAVYKLMVDCWLVHASMVLQSLLVSSTVNLNSMKYVHACFVVHWSRIVLCTCSYIPNYLDANSRCCGAYDTYCCMYTTSVLRL